MGCLTISLLGPFQATLDGRPVAGLHAERVRALLAFLAVEADEAHTRQTLAALLWPEESNDVALGNLRYTLSHLRRALGDTPTPPATPILAVTRESLRFNPESACRVDVSEFLRLCGAAAAPADSQAKCARLEEAAALYRGPFLEGFLLPGSAPFEDWLFWTREQLQHTMIAALRRLVRLYLLAGRYEDAQAAARQQVQLEPLDEEAHRQLIAVLAMDGQRSAALRQFEICRRRLAQELSVEPMPETIALAEAIRSSTFERQPHLSSWIDDPPQASLPDPSPPDGAALAYAFVARDRELQQLDRHLAEAMQGHGRVVFVTGDAGSGKTALLREFARRALAAHADLVVASGSCNAATGMGDPYLPFREIVQMLAGDIEARRAAGAISAEHARRLWALLPHVAQILLEQGPDLVGLFVPGAELLLRADSAMLGSEGAAWRARLARLVQSKLESTPQRMALLQSHLCEQVTRVLQGVARRSPLVLLLDDLQWVDNASVSLLFHLGRHLAGSHILVVGAYRSPDLALGRQGARHPLDSVIHEFQRDFGAIQVDLEEAAGRAFLDALLESEPNRLDEAFRDTLFRHTGGHALFTIELLRALQARGDLVRDAQGRWIEGPSLDWERIPPRVEAVIAERISRLPQDARTLLAAASVVGYEFSAEVVAGMLGLERAEVLKQLSGRLDKEHRLVRAHRMIWLEPGRRSLAYYHFQQPLFQEYLYRQLDPVELARLHQATGEALAQIYGVQASEIAIQLAHHFERAGLKLVAVEHLYTAAEQAMRLGAHKEAVADLYRGLTLLAALPETPERAQHELRLRVALARPLAVLYGLGDTARADVVIPAVGLSQRAGDGTQAIYALYLQADVYRGQGNFAQALELGREMLAQAEARQDRQAALLAHYTLGATALYGGDIRQARSELEGTLRLCRDDEDRLLAALIGLDFHTMTLIWLSLALWFLGDVEQSADQARLALSLAQRRAEPLTWATALAMVIWLWLYSGSDEDVRPWVETLQRLVDENRIELLRPWAGTHYGWLLAGRGQVAEGVAQMRRSILNRRQGSTALGRPMLLAALAQVCLEAALYGEGLRAVDEALDLLK